MPGSRSRLPERSVLVLTSLAGGDKHGYALIKDIEAFSGLTLGPGTSAMSKLRTSRLPVVSRSTSLEGTPRRTR